MGVAKITSAEEGADIKDRDHTHIEGVGARTEEAKNRDKLRTGGTDHTYILGTCRPTSCNSIVMQNDPILCAVKQGCP